MIGYINKTARHGFLLIMLIFVCALTSFAASTELVGMGGGGVLRYPLINPCDKKNFVVASDMGGLYYTVDAGANWERTETNATVNTTAVSDDGVFFVGGYGLYASFDKGRTISQIYPKNVIYRVSRGDNNEDLMLSDGYKNSYVLSIAAYDKKIYFVTVDWYDTVKLLSCDYNGDSLSLLYEAKYDVSPENAEFELTVDKNGVYFTDSTSVYKIGNDKTLYLLYTSNNEIVSLKKIADSFYFLENTSTDTKVVRTDDFAEFEDINARNNLDNTFIRRESRYSFDWKYSMISGKDGQNIYLVLKTHAVGYGDISGVVKYNGKEFKWVIESFNIKLDNINDPVWSYNSLGQICGIFADNNDGDRLIITNIETVYYVDYDDNRSYIKPLHSQKTANGNYATTGIDVQSTHKVRQDPFNSDHLIICTSDLRMQYSYDGGISWNKSLEIGKTKVNTFYDVYFDADVKDRVYGIWSSRHGAPFSPSLSDKGDNVYGGLAISNDGGITWDFGYSSGLPQDSIPYKMSILKEKDALVIAVATFNNGFFVSYDSGQNFVSLNSDVDNYNGYIWGRDIDLTHDKIYMLTSPYSFKDKSADSELYEYDRESGNTAKVDIGELKDVRSVVYDEKSGVHICVISNYKRMKIDGYHDKYWKNHDGGIYRYDNGVITKLFESENGICDAVFAHDGTLYAIDVRGKLYMYNGAYAQLIKDGMFPRLKDIVLSQSEDMAYITTRGGGCYQIKLAFRTYPVFIQKSKLRSFVFLNTESL